MSTSTGGLAFAVRTATRPGVTRDLPHGPEDLQWVANAVTLIYGERDAILVDTYTSIEQNDELVAWVRSFGRRLTHIYVTHGHGDHFFGVKQLLEAFPEARAVTTPESAAAAHENGQPQWLEGFWLKLFPDQIPLPIAYPEPFVGDHLDVEGHRIEIVDTGHTDTLHSTSLWVPDLGLVVGGDVVYNDTHQFLAESTTESREHWAQAAERLAELEPTYVVAGHKKPDATDDPAILAETAAYLRDFNRLAEQTSTALELYDAMLALYPRRANPGSLWGGAKLAKAAAAGV